MGGRREHRRIRSPDDFINPIDPAAFLDPTDGRLWLTYGSYVGYIRLVELDPKTGKRLHPGETPTNIGINLEATDMIYHDGWYYLLGTHGSCCAGAASGYNIRVGRSRKITGPFLDNMGVDMIEGGGKLFIGSGDRLIGAGHFGLLNLASCRAKILHALGSRLGSRRRERARYPPAAVDGRLADAGENMKEGTYEIESVRTGTALEWRWKECRFAARARGADLADAADAADLAEPMLLPGAEDLVERTALPGVADSVTPAEPTRLPDAEDQAADENYLAAPGTPIPPQDVARVSTNWPAGSIDVRMANYMVQAQQKWTVTAVTNAGGYPGSPYFKITIAGTDRALAATADGELTALPAFTGAPEELWRLDQLTDGTWRIMPKSNSKEALAISAIGSSSATLENFNSDSDRQRWLFKKP